MESATNFLTEPLEARRLFAGIALSHYGTLFVLGSRYAPNTIVVGLTPDQSAVTASVTFPGRSSVPVNITKAFPLSDRIRMLVVRGGLRDDSISIDQTDGSFTLPTRIAGGPGNDTITGGDEPDTINGGSGNDAISGGAGHDLLLGSAGNDSLIAGSGNDWMCGGPGHNSVVGGAGNDTLVSWHRGDTLLGGTGHDLFHTIGLRYSVNNYDPSKDVFERAIPPSSGGSSFLGDLLNNFFFPF